MDVELRHLHRQMIIAKATMLLIEDILRLHRFADGRGMRGPARATVRRAQPARTATTQPLPPSSPESGFWVIICT
jgi:hypothetical protein